MLTAGAKRIAWHGGWHVFCLTACGVVMALEDCRMASLAAIYARLATGVWYAADIRETVRLALVGGGLPRHEADRLVEEFVDRHPGGLLASLPLAVGLIETAIVGVPDDKIGEPSPQGPRVSSNDFLHDDGRMKRSAILGLGAGLGWTSSQTYAASVWELGACIKGYNQANGAGEVNEPPTNEEFDAMLEIHKIRVH